MSPKDPFEEGCAVLREAAELINAIASTDEYKRNLNLQSVATDSILIINRFIWELRQAHGKESESRTLDQAAGNGS
jgi:hypothetical protein